MGTCVRLPQEKLFLYGRSTATPTRDRAYQTTYAGLSESCMKELFLRPSRDASEDDVDTRVVTLVVLLWVVVLTLSTLILKPFRASAPEDP